MKLFGWICVVLGALSLIGAASAGHSIFGPVFWLALGIALLYFGNQKEKEKKKNEVGSTPKPQQPARVEPKPVQVAEPIRHKTYWKNYKNSNPTKASDIEKLLKIDFSKLSEKDIKEKIGSVERFAKSLKCDISQIKATYLSEIEKYPAELIPQMIESTSREQEKEASIFHVAQANTMSAMMTAWLKERHEQMGKPDAKIDAPSTQDEMEILKQLDPLTTDVVDLRERLKSLREMSALFKCPMSELREFYIKDVKKNYDGKYENFHYLPEAYVYMANKAYDVAPSIGLKPKNTSYGIICDWLSDFMKEERIRFINTGQVECMICGSHDISLNYFKDHFVCNSCKEEFGGI